MRAKSSPSVSIEPVIKILRRLQADSTNWRLRYFVSLSAFIFFDKIRNWEGVNAKDLYYSTIAEIGWRCFPAW